MVSKRGNLEKDGFNIVIQIKPLADCPEHFVQSLAELWREEIGQHWAPSSTTEQIVQRFLLHRNQDTLPVMFVALDGPQPIGMGCLRITEGILPGLTPWIGGLVVAPKYRKTLTMVKLVRACVLKAKSLGYATIYILAFDQKLAEKYRRILNCEILGSDLINQHPVTVMRFQAGKVPFSKSVL
jgi:GNAT superfamily N-acetyltransferase